MRPQDVVFDPPRPDEWTAPLIGCRRSSRIRHSSCSLSWKLSICPFFHGLPGRMQRALTSQTSIPLLPLAPVERRQALVEPRAHGLRRVRPPAAYRRMWIICSPLTLLFFMPCLLPCFAAELQLCHVQLSGGRSKVLAHCLRDMARGGRLRGPMPRWLFDLLSKQPTNTLGDRSPAGGRVGSPLDGKARTASPRGYLTGLRRARYRAL